MRKAFRTFQHEVAITAALIVAVGEGLFTLVPDPWQTVLLAGWPLLVGVVARTQVVPVAKVQQLIEQLISDVRPKPKATAPVVVPSAPVAQAPPPPPSTVA